MMKAAPNIAKNLLEGKKKRKPNTEIVEIDEEE